MQFIHAVHFTRGQMSRLLLCLFIMILINYGSIGYAEKQLIVLRFDFGTSESPVKPGWIRVTHETVYPNAEGKYAYGLNRTASSSFDRAGIFVPDWMKGAIKEKFPLDDMLRDGVFDKGDLTFRADVPDGEYWLVVSIGDEQATRRNMSVSVNGNTVAEKVTTQTSWGGYATTRTFRQRILATNGKVEIAFKNEGDGNSILGIELISFVPYPIQFEGEKWYSAQADENLQKGLSALSQGKWQDALAAFEAISDPLLQANAFLTLSDLLDVPEIIIQDVLGKTILLTDGILESAPPDSSDGILAAELNRISAGYLQARWFINLLSYEDSTRQTGLAFSRRLWMAEDLCQQITADDPLFDRACLNIGRIHYWFWREDGDSNEKRIADKYFSILKERQPSNRLVRMYTGENIPWSEEYSSAMEGMPEWAVKQREAMSRLLEVIRWWIDNRQLDNGEMGGGYGDDVEMLRQWHVFLGGADDETVKRGWLKLAHGIWYSGNIDTERGYAALESDVQHSAEDVSDSQPAMIGLDYGSPIWIYRCMKTMRTMRDFWTSINSLGHRHFKSASIGATSMNVKPNWGVDIPCNGRATRPGLWAGWYSRNPEIVKLFREWMDAWVEDAMREEEGKPKGVIPAAIAYETDKIGGYGKNWYEPEIYWDYFNWPGYTDKIYDHLLAVYDWTGDEKYLKPIEAAMELAMEANPVDNPQKGTREWAAKTLYESIAPVIEKYRVLTGRADYDDYLRENGSAYMRFLLTGDKSYIIRGCESAAASARFNFELKTSEVLFTDRISVTQEPMWGMLTGGVGKAYFYPCYFVTWHKTSSDFAALVTSADNRFLRVLVCNFSTKPREVGMDLWRLEPGVYELRAGPDKNNDDQMDGVTERRNLEIYERGQTVQLKLPSQSVQVIEIDKKGELKYSIPAFYDRPDLAVGEQDVFIGKTPAEVEGSGEIWGWKDMMRKEPETVKTAKETPITVVVHNLGKQSQNPIVVKLLYNRSGKWVEADQAVLTEFETSDELAPSKAVAELKWRPISSGDYNIIIQVEYQTPQMEITHRNNVLVKSVRAKFK